MNQNKKVKHKHVATALLRTLSNIERMIDAAVLDGADRNLLNRFVRTTMIRKFQS